MSSPDPQADAREAILVTIEVLQLAIVELAATMIPPPGNADELTRVTVHLTETQYRRIKRFGINQRMQSQTIMVQALLEYLDREEGKGP
jgi:hypothetical protein